MAMHRETGKEVTGLEEIEQAVDTILGTIPGDRVMRADYGSELFVLTDVGMDASGKARFTRAVGEALNKFEPRVVVQKVDFEGEPGSMTQTVRGAVRTTSEQVAVKVKT
jgi:phage baseplate assembly protein W